MSESKTPLDAEEVEFLLAGEEPEKKAPVAEEAIQNAHFVTIKGDLSNISLSDIFQTLSMSQMTGTLRITSPTGVRLVYFDQGKVQLVGDQENRNRLLGDKLIAAGILNPSDLKNALLRQKAKGGRIGDILVGMGVISREQVESVIQMHEEEEIYSLFTWKRATFEFFKGEEPPQDSVRSNFYDVSGILLEVARRKDEWEIILEKIGDLDEIFLTLPEAKRTGVSENVAKVLPFLDGTRSVRDVARATLVPLFECAKAIAFCVDQGIVRKATLQELNRLVDRMVRNGHIKEAVRTLAVIKEEREITSPEDARLVARAFKTIHDMKSAAEVLVEAARNLREKAPGIARELLAEAVELDPKNLQARVDLRSFLDPREDQEEYLRLTQELCDLFFEKEMNQRALEEVEELSRIRPEDPGVLARVARVHQRAGDPERAEEALETMARIFREEGKTQQLVTVLEHLTKLNPRKKEAQRELRELKRKKTDKRKALLVGSGIALTLGLALFFTGKVVLRRHREATLEKELSRLVSQGESDRALALAGKILEELPDSPVALRAARVKRKIEAAREEIRRKAREAKEAKIRAVLEEASRFQEEGRLDEALLLYKELLPRIRGHKKFLGILGNVRLPSIAEDLQEMADAMERALAKASDNATTLKERKAALEILRKVTDPSRKEVLLRIKEILAHWPFEVFQKTCPKETIEKPLNRILKGREKASRLEARLEKDLAEERLAKKLDPLIKGARAAERKWDFRKAWKLYSEVARLYRKDNELRAYVVSRARKFRAVLDKMEELEALAKKQDFPRALAVYKALKRMEPRAPFERMVRLPLKVESVPPGARIFFDGRAAGKTPLPLEFHPQGSHQVVFRKEGFDPVSLHFKGTGRGRLLAWLPRRRAWAAPLPGPVDQPALLAGKDYLVADRAGILTCLDPERGKEKWVFRTGDFSGKIFRPMVRRGKVFLVSAEGTVRCLSLKEGRLLWKKKVAPSGAGPALAGPSGVLVFTGRPPRLLCLDPGEGRLLWSRDLKGALSSPPVLSGRKVYFGIRPGLLSARDAGTGSPLWTRVLPDLCVGAPAADKTQVVVACLDGSILAFTPKGSPSWKTRLTAPLSLPPLFLGDRVLALPQAKRVVLLKRQGGKVLREIPLKAAPSSPGAFLEGKVYLGLDDGTLLCLDPEEWQVLWSYRDGRPIAAPPAGDARILVLPTQSRLLLGFPGRLPGNP